jgi:hypothetical protein
MSICRTGLGTRTKNPQIDDLEPMLVKPRDAWRLLGCSNTYGYELLTAGELDSFKDGKARKITVASIKSYISRRLEAAKDAASPPPTAAGASKAQKRGQARTQAYPETRRGIQQGARKGFDLDLIGDDEGQGV